MSLRTVFAFLLVGFFAVAGYAVADAEQPADTLVGVSQFVFDLDTAASVAHESVAVAQADAVLPGIATAAVHPMFGVEPAVLAHADCKSLLYQLSSTYG